MDDLTLAQTDDVTLRCAQGRCQKCGRDGPVITADTISYSVSVCLDCVARPHYVDACRRSMALLMRLEATYRDALDRVSKAPVLDGATNSMVGTYCRICNALYMTPIGIEDPEEDYDDED